MLAARLCLLLVAALLSSTVCEARRYPTLLSRKSAFMSPTGSLTANIESAESDPTDFQSAGSEPADFQSEPVALVAGPKFLRRVGRSGLDNDSTSQLGEEEAKSCVIEVPSVQRLEGKCMTLMGGQPACQSDTHLDPLTTQCA